MIQDYIVTVLAAGLVTIQVALVALVISVVLGMSFALCKLSSNAALRGAAEVYTTIVRGIPDLVLMLLIYYSLPALLMMIAKSLGIRTYIEFDSFVAGAVTLGVVSGAYMTETFRGAILNIPEGQIEAGRAFGMGPFKIWRSIVLPQMVRLAIPGFTNNWLVLFKATALISLIGLQDIMFRVKGAAEATRQPFTFYLVACVFYLTVAALSLLVLRYVAKRADIGQKRA
ncbi:MULTISPECIES: ABC transporter permease subunit [unclassified Devosia]|uniref:ABC transporter permease n=1 Tax=unclassified Devosia TaxID=196773 RepID=UPI00145E7033|nr:ABC transporter permease subunit [Devosia sp. MC521]MBJ6988076.1 ABC transporter permease subunit [Devosia sp. MC521]QMW63365.1 ABC transporter permease subunit [Devosia sp. MC521]